MPFLIAIAHLVVMGDDTPLRHDGLNDTLSNRIQEFNRRLVKFALERFYAERLLVFAFRVCDRQYPEESDVSARCRRPAVLKFRAIDIR
jgi:hypothetical protein